MGYVPSSPSVNIIMNTFSASSRHNLHTIFIATELPQGIKEVSSYRKGRHPCNQIFSGPRGAHYLTALCDLPPSPWLTQAPSSPNSCGDAHTVFCSFLCILLDSLLSFSRENLQTQWQRFLALAVRWDHLWHFFLQYQHVDSTQRFWLNPSEAKHGHQHF